MKNPLKQTFLAFNKWFWNIQAAGYNGARTLVFSILTACPAEILVRIRKNTAAICIFPTRHQLYLLAKLDEHSSRLPITKPVDFAYRTRAIISRGLYIFYPNSQDHLCIVTFGLMYGLYSRAASNQERPMMARVRYLLIIDQHDSCM